MAVSKPVPCGLKSIILALRYRRLPCGITLFLLLGFLDGTVAAGSEDPTPTAERLVTVEFGDLPILLSAPHGGSEPIPGVAPRSGAGIARFTTVTDAFTGQLTEKLADAIERRTGRRPYVVIARFRRRFVDANRPAGEAYESTDAQPVYEYYHQAISAARREIIERWGRGLLLDIHGQAKSPTTIYRGTQNGKTDLHLSERFGHNAVRGPRSLFGQLRSEGFEVHPTPDSDDPEAAGYSGGYIVGRWGSRSGGSLDAVQLELGRRLREPDNNTATARRLATAILRFSEDFLPHSEVFRASHQYPLLGEFDSDWFACDDTPVTAQDTPRDLPPLSGMFRTYGPLRETDLKSFGTHFTAVTLKQPGDSVHLQFDALHNISGFVDRGFRFGLLNSNNTTCLTNSPDANRGAVQDDRGCFTLLDLGSATTHTSALLRMTNGSSIHPLWDGRTVADAKNGTGRDPLMLTAKRPTTYHLELSRRQDSSLQMTLWNQLSGRRHALKATVLSPPTWTFDTALFATTGDNGQLSVGNIRLRHSNSPPNTVAGEMAPVRVGLYADRGAGNSVRNLLYVLSQDPHLHVRTLTAEEIRSDGLIGLDVLIQPGGTGRGQAEQLQTAGREAIRRFVQGGGGYIGVCAGAYLASADYEWSLHLLDARVVDRKHWNRGVGTVQLQACEPGLEIFELPEPQFSLLYAQGPLLAPAEKPDLPDFHALATFSTEVAKNGAPQGIMVGTTAIAAGEYGRGRVLCFSPHPELTPGRETMLCRAIRYAAPQTDQD